MATRRVFPAAAMLLMVYPFAARGVVTLWAQPRTYPVDEVPVHRVAIVFGAQVYRNGRPSAMLADRVAAAVDLYHQGRVDALLLSGDNSTADYNEPAAMRDEALRLGVPAEAITLDYGGRRTYDTCWRARHIFEVTDAVAVTQAFHLPRALLLCHALGIEAVGLAADYQRPTGYSRVAVTYSQVREYPAVLLALWDAIRQPPPPIIGEPLPIFPGVSSE